MLKKILTAIKNGTLRSETKGFFSRKYLEFVERLLPKGLKAVSDDTEHVYLTKTVNPISKSLFSIDEDYVRYASLEMTALEINRKQLQGEVAELGVFRGDFAKEINRLFPNYPAYNNILYFLYHRIF